VHSVAAGPTAEPVSAKSDTRMVHWVAPAYNEEASIEDLIDPHGQAIRRDAPAAPPSPGEETEAPAPRPG